VSADPFLKFASRGATPGNPRGLALYLVVAWRIAHLMRKGRTCPDLDAKLFFDPDEIQVAYLLNKTWRRPRRAWMKCCGRSTGRRLPRTKQRWRNRPERSGRDCVMSLLLLIPSRTFVKRACYRVVFNEVGLVAHRRRR